MDVSLLVVLAMMEVVVGGKCHALLLTDRSQPDGRASLRKPRTPDHGSYSEALRRRTGSF
ncbi:MAG: hypothetical protein Q8M26_00700 [Pseudolabrys sp.]|nr:hypothetical protein [Pseudolabrys sp.]